MNELTDASQELIQVEADAKMAASLEAPPLLKLVDRQAREREAYLVRHGVEDIQLETVADYVKVGYEDLTLRHDEEAKREQVLHGKSDNG